MPPSYTDDQIVYAVRDGLIIPAQLDRMAQGMIDLVNKTRAAMSIDNYRFDVDAHDEVAHQAAIESIVMLKNDDAILPLNAGPVANPSATPQKIAVIGEFARTPRYQGGGSSHITPTKMTSFLDTLAERGIKADFAPGFTLDLYLVKSVFRVSSLIFFGFRHEACRPVVCFTGCPSCRT